MVNKDFNPRLSHPLYFIRKGLYNNISEIASNFKGKLLDFGCGAKPYKELFVNVDEYVGVDFNSEGHSHKDEVIDFYYNGEVLPFENNTFDSIFTSEVFEHVFNLKNILNELNRVLKIDGRVLITCPFVWEEHEIPNDYARYTQFALKNLISNAGFEIIEFKKSGNTLQAIHQLFIVYINDFWLNNVYFFSKFNLFKKIVRQLLVPFLNILFYFLQNLFPKNDKLYLNNILLIRKISSINE